MSGLDLKAPLVFTPNQRPHMAGELRKIAAFMEGRAEALRLAEVQAAADSVWKLADEIDPRPQPSSERSSDG
jgi:hypothetical protein